MYLDSCIRIFHAEYVFILIRVYFPPGRCYECHNLQIQNLGLLLIDNYLHAYVYSTGMCGFFVHFSWNFYGQYHLIA